MGSNGILIIVVGLLIIYLGITGRYKCFSCFISCISGNESSDCCSQKQVASNTVAPLLPLNPLNLAPKYPQ